jgi:hypothetical protein
MLENTTSTSSGISARRDNICCSKSLAPENAFSQENGKPEIITSLFSANKLRETRVSQIVCLVFPSRDEI